MKHASTFSAFFAARVIVILLFSCAVFVQVSAQNKKLDSLKQVTASPGSLALKPRIDLINRLSYELRVSVPDVAMSSSKEALRLSKENDYSIGECDANVTLGLLYWLVPEFDKSIAHGLRALHLSDSLHYKKGAMEANLALGLVYNELGDYARAEALTKHGLDIALQTEHTEGIARACNALGNHYRRRNQGKEALQYYQMGLDHLKGKTLAIKNLLLNNIALYYIKQDIEHEKTRQYLEEALQIALAFENKSAEVLTLVRMGIFYTNMNEFPKAEEQFAKAKTLSIALGNHNAFLDIYRGLTDLKTKAGRPLEAQAYEIKYLKVKDSLFSLDKARQVAEMETRF